MYYSLIRHNSKAMQTVLLSLQHGRHDVDELKKDLAEFKKLKNNLVACC